MHHDSESNYVAIDARVATVSQAKNAGKRSLLPGIPSTYYLAFKFTVNELLGLLVSVPLKETWPVELRVPAAGTLKLTVTIMV